MHHALSKSSPELHIAIANTIRQVRIQIRWKPGKAIAHLEKRIERGHLPSKTTLEEYFGIVHSIVFDDEAFVYCFHFGGMIYPAIVSTFNGRSWLAMFSLDGIMETAFPPDQPETYLADKRYQLVGKVEEFVL